MQYCPFEIKDRLIKKDNDNKTRSIKQYMNDKSKINLNIFNNINECISTTYETNDSFNKNDNY